MKKLVTILLTLIMVLGLGAYVYADEVCDLSEEDQALVLEVKSKFLGEKVADGSLSQEEADKIYESLTNQDHNQTLRGLGFGMWLRDSGNDQKLEGILTHKNRHNSDGNRRRGRHH